MLQIKLLCLVTCNAQSFLLQVKGITFLISDLLKGCCTATVLALKSYIPITTKIGPRFLHGPSQVLFSQNKHCRFHTPTACCPPTASAAILPCGKKQNHFLLENKPQLIFYGGQDASSVTKLTQCSGGIFTIIFQTERLGRYTREGSCVKRFVPGWDLLLLNTLSSSKSCCEHEVMCVQLIAGEMPPARDSSLAFCRW